MQLTNESNKTGKNLEQVLKGRENYFDLIRLIAAIMVIFSHAYPLSGAGYDDPLHRFSNGQVTLGNLAVFVFFIISGLLITQSYLYSNNIITFLKARVLRIFPGLIGVLLFSAFIIGPLVTSLPFGDYLSNRGVLTYLKAVFLFPMQWNLPGVFEDNAYGAAVNGSLWTIPFEFLCYLIVGVLGLLRILKHKYLVLFLTACIFYYYIFSGTIAPAGAGHLFGLEVNTLMELLLFFMMGTLACLFKDKIFFNKHLAMVCLLVLYISLYYGGFKSIFAVCGTYVILFLAFLPSGKLSKITARGDFSYGIYLYAFPVQQTITYLFGGKTTVWINFILSLMVTFVLAILSWYIVERNFLKLKKMKLPGEKKMFFEMLLKKRLFGTLSAVYNQLFRVNWLRFLVFFVLFIIGFTFYNAKPNEIEFPYLKSESIFQGGWLPQSSSENYRWVAQRASVDLSFPSKDVTLRIEGFVPESFKEVNYAILYIDNNLVQEVHIKSGEGFLMKVPYNGKGLSHLVTMEFNAIHVPDKDDADQREMSALISKISIEE
ncbi:acyltransferase family protein [Paenibacillus sp. FSL R7-0331]|uniref:acyltransferase family protein n=1 Tax=Paenibacillus sp. FSL R7-0331 TaxID=1536773 RepID=UPI000693C6AE|nr:acyltransferase [Paenibacillus sp. FSL R7-0331]